MPPTPTPSFGQQHFGAARLGDSRRIRCLIDLADRFLRHPGGTLPDKLKDPNALRRCYDLMKAMAVTHHSVLEPHVQHTLDQLPRHRGVALVVHDTTELDFTTITSLHPQLGQIGNGSAKGYLCLNSLAVLPGRGVLGLLGQILHCRPHVPKDQTRQERRDKDDRETLLWLHAVDSVRQATGRCRRRLGLTQPPDGLLEIDGVDRGGDTFEFLDHEDLHNRKYVVRSRFNRSIQVGHHADEAAGHFALLHDHLGGLPEQGRRTVELPDRPERPARTATLAVAWAAVTVQAPENPRGRHRAGPLRVWALRVWEPAPPAGCEAVEWFLLTNVAVGTLARAWEAVSWYCGRWVVEEFHKAQKTGCAIESPQLTRAERLQPLIALLSVVATQLVQLRDASRDKQAAGRPATGRVDEEYVEVLSGWRYRERRPLTCAEFFLALARLGGHQNRRLDHPPGWLVLWRGWQALQLMVEGARAVRRLERHRAAPATPSARPREPDS
jgi:Transposase DNA-binding